ncbi:hypothetical protein BDW69DRAFT_197807 [Aspergillus filifer]
MPGPSPGLQYHIAGFTVRAIHPPVDHGLLSDTAALLSIDITTGNHGQNQTVEDAWNTVQDAKAGKPDPLDMAVGFTKLKAIPANVLDLLNGHADLELNSVENPPEDAPFSVEEDDLRAAIYIPESFQYGKNGKKPVILVPGTAVPAGLTYYSSFGRLVEVVPEADVVWVIIPSTSSGDVARVNVAIIAWSQGNFNTQWSFKYWPSTRNVVDNYIAISPDYHGTVLADAICPLLTGIFCTPAFFQQRYETDYIDALRADGEGSAYVPTTTVYSAFDEIIVCANQPAGGLYATKGCYSPLTWALAVDALHVLASQLGPDDLLGSEGLILVAAAESLAFAPKPLKEPPVAGYAL